jgi:prepilin-type N-terminal cleavage/methylation domain-containing protein
MRILGMRGFTMLEVLIAASLLGTAMLALASMFPIGFLNVNYGGDMSRATHMARQKIEELRNVPFTALTSGADTPAADDPGLTRTWDVNVAGVSPTRLATVTVTVVWTETTGRPRQVVMASQIAE